MPDQDASAQEVWRNISGKFGNQEDLAKLLEQVGPEKYNDFTTSGEYLSSSPAPGEGATTSAAEVPPADSGPAPVKQPK